MSNLALATNPASKIVSADNLLVAPDEQMLLVNGIDPLSSHPSRDYRHARSHCLQYFQSAATTLSKRNHADSTAPQNIANIRHVSDELNTRAITDAC